MANKSDVKVFLSFPSTETTWAKSLASFLEKEGASVFAGAGDVRDSGGSVRERVTRALEESEAVVLILDSTSSQSPWVGFEYGAARSLGKRVISVLAPGTRMNQVRAFENVLDRSSTTVRSGDAKSVAARVMSLARAASTG